MLKKLFSVVETFVVCWNVLTKGSRLIILAFLTIDVSRFHIWFLVSLGVHFYFGRTSVFASYVVYKAFDVFAICQRKYSCHFLGCFWKICFPFQKRWAIGVLNSFSRSFQSVCCFICYSWRCLPRNLIF